MTRLFSAQSMTGVPFEAARDLDLSYAAAKVIDMIALGIAVVRIEYIGIDTEYFKAVRDIFKNAD